MSGVGPADCARFSATAQLAMLSHYTDLFSRRALTLSPRNTLTSLRITLLTHSS